ncbi:MAG: hypothetical protein MR592_04000, partial [Prevotella sp.]|nr:hypothetical protein [Prevotella sp.]
WVCAFWLVLFGRSFRGSFFWVRSFGRSFRGSFFGFVLLVILFVVRSLGSCFWSFFSWFVLWVRAFGRSFRGSFFCSCFSVVLFVVRSFGHSFVVRAFGRSFRGSFFCSFFWSFFLWFVLLGARMCFLFYALKVLEACVARSEVS